MEFPRVPTSLMRCPGWTVSPSETWTYRPVTRARAVAVAAAAAPDTGAPVVVPAVAEHDDAIARARESVEAERRARATWEAAIADRRRLVDAALESAPKGVNERCDR